MESGLQCADGNIEHFRGLGVGQPVVVAEKDEEFLVAGESVDGGAEEGQVGGVGEIGGDVSWGGKIGGRMPLACALGSVGGGGRLCRGRPCRY